jgi:hypothetical protein
MDQTISWLRPGAALDPFDQALLEVSAAIALVLAGVAMTITLSFFEGGEGAAFTAAAWAQAAGVAFRLRREPPASVSLVIGPRLRVAPVEADPELER